MGTVRVIVRQDWENGKAYTDDVIDVRAGYARNYLIPQKLAVYATRENFFRFNVPNPDQETAEQRKERLAREASAEDKDLKAHDLLRKYLRNKTVRHTPRTQWNESTSHKESSSHCSFSNNNYFSAQTVEESGQRDYQRYRQYPTAGQSDSTRYGGRQSLAGQVIETVED